MLSLDVSWLKKKENTKYTLRSVEQNYHIVEKLVHPNSILCGTIWK
jgi:hypothetical protein